LAAMLLEISDLRLVFHTPQGIVHALNGVNLTLEKGKVLGIVGETGCGKSVTGLSIMRLVPCPPGRYVSGEVLFEGNDLLKLPITEIRDLRGREIAMIFQDPMTSLNPVLSAGDQVAEAMQLHQHIGRREAIMKAVELFENVKMPDSQEMTLRYPHQLSGGMQQRVMIAMALSCKPKLLIADEATSALDVTIQAQVLSLMRELKNKTGLTLLLITHDMGVVAEMCDDVAVMYAGSVVESGELSEIFNKPLHPYTRGLLDCIPKPHVKEEKLPTIGGSVIDLINLPSGCAFEPRCAESQDICRKEPPTEALVGRSHRVRCFLNSGN